MTEPSKTHPDTFNKTPKTSWNIHGNPISCCNPTPPKFTTDGTTEEINLFQNGVRQRVESLAMEKQSGRIHFNILQSSIF